LCWTSCPTHLLQGLTLLRETREVAEESQRDPWEFALEIAQLHAAGLSNTDLRRLLLAGLVEHGVEQYRLRGSRQFRRLTGLALPADTCFVLTEAGVQAAFEAAALPLGAGAALTQSVLPCWNSSLRLLCWKGAVVKRFRLPATNQETILSVFEEESWPARIDDPLKQGESIDPKTRLRDAIKALNRNQVNRLLSFRGDGTGRGILWGNR
jgi:hypothetical protein